MRSFAATNTEGYIWFQPARFEREFELRHNEETLATLRFESPPIIVWEYKNPHPATLISSHGQWNLSVQRKGLLGLAGVIQAKGVNDVTLDAGMLLLRGLLVFADGKRLLWRGGLWRNSSDVFVDQVGLPLVRLSPGNFFERINACVTITSPDRPVSELLLLAGLGLYMRFLMNKVYR